MTTTLPSTTSDRPSRKLVGRQELSTRLLGSAAKKSYDPVVAVDWTAPVPEHLYGLSPEWSTLYGTPLWTSLDEPERVRLTVHEYCSISGVGIWFECLLMQLVLRDIYGEDPAQPHVQWARRQAARRRRRPGRLPPRGRPHRRPVRAALEARPPAVGQRE
jgi:hypothetical protein